MNLSQDIVDFVKEVVEHFHDQALIRGLTWDEQMLYKSALSMTEQIVIEGQLQSAGLFTGKLSNISGDKN